MMENEKISEDLKGLVDRAMDDKNSIDLNKADIFFVPVSSMDEEVYSKESNYVEAYESYEKLGKTKMKLVPVASLYDIIDYLSDYQGGK